MDRERNAIWDLGLAAGVVALAGYGVYRLLGGGGAVQGPAPAPGCHLQPPQDFLVRSNFLRRANGNDEAVTYRTLHYGYFAPFGDPSLNPFPPASYAVQTSFMGIPVRLNRKVVPSLRCVEAEIKSTCGDAYRPQALSGLRMKNSYHDFEVSNHVYGIALDVDPNLNPCCGCVGHWSEDPRCRDKSASAYDRMVMPRCWVDVFERYGWYWLGHDPQLQDTMHFEFLGVPPE